ncbi:MAG: hypothetical protein ABI880_14135 [Acidobacteriota bacterium]
MTTSAQLLSAAVVATFVGGAAAASAQTVSGQFALGGKPLKPTHVAAFRMRDTRAPRTMQTYVMLTLTAVDAATIGAAIDPYALAINDQAVREADYIGLHINADGQTTINTHSGGTQYMDSSGMVMGQQGSLVATCKENTAERIACTVKTAKPVKPIDGPSWTLDVTFAAPITTRAPGQPLPPDGGPAGQALLALVKAVSGGNLANIVALLTPNEAKGYQESYNSSAENLRSAKDVLGVRLPKQPKITGGELLAPDHAVLEVEGMPFPESRTLYLVEMRLNGGRWQYDNSVPAGRLR